MRGIVIVIVMGMMMIIRGSAKRILYS